MAAAADKMSLDKKGFKRICMSCSTRFYDFNKRPIVCPSCKAEFTGEIKVKSRRGRAVAANDDETAAPQEAEEDVVVRGDDTVSLEEVEALEEGSDEDAEIPVIEDMDEDLDDAAEDEEEEEEEDK